MIWQRRVFNWLQHRSSVYPSIGQICFKTCNTRWKRFYTVFSAVRQYFYIRAKNSTRYIQVLIPLSFARSYLTFGRTCIWKSGWISLKAHVFAQVQADIFHETKYDHEKLNGIKVYTYLAGFFLPEYKNIDWARRKLCKNVLVGFRIPKCHCWSDKPILCWPSRFLSEVIWNKGNPVCSRQYKQPL